MKMRKVKTSEYEFQEIPTISEESKLMLELSTLNMLLNTTYGHFSTSPLHNHKMIKNEIDKLEIKLKVMNRNKIISNLLNSDDLK